MKCCAAALMLPLLLAAAACATLGVSNSVQLTKVRVADKAIAAQAYLYLAIDQGYFREQGWTLIWSASMAVRT